MALHDVLVDAIIAGEHVLLPADAGSEAFDAVAMRLAALQSRVLRPATADGLSLAGLLAQVVGRSADVLLTGPDLEHGFELLTEPGPRCKRIVLMLDRADALDPAALRYIQFASRDSPLQLLFSGGPAFHALLGWEEFGLLRRGFVPYAPALTESLPPLQATAQAVPFPGPEAALAAGPPSGHPAPPRRVARWVLAGMGMAASVAYVAWLLPPQALASYLVSAGWLRSSVRAALLP